MEKPVHYSVLLRESVDALVVDPSGTYVDGTFGRGGHSRAILDKLSTEGRLIGFDKDPEAVQVGKALTQSDSRFTMVHGSFASIADVAQMQVNATGVQGVLLDLGVSSPQLDQAERGFSFMNDGPLDMRMDPSQGQSAADWVNNTKEDEITRVLKEFGEERFARRMAKAICLRREQQPFQRTKDLADVITAANPKWERDKHPATRAFQAIRVAVNAELSDLALGLEASLKLLNSGGRLVVISFHSLEDRLVKRFMKKQAVGEQYPKHLPVTAAMQNQTLKLIGKAIKASEEEVKNNIRSRSAVMRIAEKL